MLPAYNIVPYNVLCQTWIGGAALLGAAPPIQRESRSESLTWLVNAYATCTVASPPDGPGRYP